MTGNSAVTLAGGMVVLVLVIVGVVIANRRVNHVHIRVPKAERVKRRALRRELRRAKIRELLAMDPETVIRLQKRIAELQPSPVKKLSPPGWSSRPGWPSAQPGWRPADPPVRGAPGERNSRAIPQGVKIAVSVRDQGKCVQCGSTEDLHFDHKVPWSRGGTNTVNNIQLLCGRCNRRKGADDIPV
jgi:HNH endonuclease